MTSRIGDSLEQINLLVAIEKKFSIKFKLEDVKNLPNVGAMLDLGQASGRLTAVQPKMGAGVPNRLLFF